MKSCGFEEIEPGSHKLKMEEDNLKSFVDKYEEKTQSKIVDIHVA